MIGDDFLGEMGCIGEVARLRREYESRIDALKTKARRLVDVAYNKAVNDALAAVGDDLSAEAKAKLVALRRTVREV